MQFTFKQILFLVLLWATLLQSNGALQLDDATRKLVLSLFREFSNKTLLAELIVNGGIGGQKVVAALEHFPAEPVAEIYRNYTLKQITALETELSEHDHFIYEPIEEKTRLVKAQFGAACQSYDSSGNLKQFEHQFIDTGKELVSLQKMVLRIINSKLEEKLIPTKPSGRSRVGRNWVYNFFDQLNGLFLGTQPNELYKSAEYSQVNKMYSLMQALEKIENVQTTDERMKANIDTMKVLLYKLRKVYELNKIASEPNHYLNTDNISPFNYEAMLRLVQLLGAAQNLNQTFSPMMTMFRSWMNFFNGGNVFSSLMNPFTDATANQPTRKPKYDANKLRQLMKVLEENEQNRQQQIEKNRQKAALENLIKKQNMQQQQINDILKTLANKQTTPATEVYITSTKKPWLPPNVLPTRWPSPALPTMSPNSPADFLKKLKEQRKHLNELLQELQKPINPSKPGGSGVSSGVAPTWPNLFPGSTNRPANAVGSGSMPTTNDLMQAQQALMGIMKNITPLISMMGESGMVSVPRIEKSKFQLLDILNSINNRELDDIEDKDKEMQRVEKLGTKLESVLDGIIDEAEKKT